MILFNKILIANRGEIAVRIINSAKKLGIKTVTIYSEVDADSMHVELSDESYCIGKLELSDTYLNIKKIIDVAKKTNCEAIHPGYGFLAENPEFVKECEKANIVFIGPSSSVIKLMGNKIEARNFIKKIDVPIIDGITGDTKTLLRQSKNIPFPLLSDFRPLRSPAFNFFRTIVRTPICFNFRRFPSTFFPARIFSAMDTLISTSDAMAGALAI